MKNSKFKKGQKVSYLGNKAEVRSLNWCIYAEDFVYNVKYRNENNTRFGVTTYENDQTLKAR